jgi:hypothetical protein
MENFSLADEYKDYWAEGKKRLESGEVEVLEGLFPLEKDKRKSLGLFFWQDKIKKATLPYLEELKHKYPEEIIFYGSDNSPARQHITFLELIKTSEGWEDEEVVRQALTDGFKEVCDQTLSKMPPIRAKFQGFAANSNTIISKGYPENNAFNEFRGELRRAIEKAGLPPLMRREVKIFHSTVGRYTAPIKNPKKLLHFIEKYEEVSLGIDVFDTLYLSTASWLMAEGQVRVIKKYELG